MSPHPPQKAKPWLGVPRGFPAAPAELGELARLDFSHHRDLPIRMAAASASAVQIADPPQAAPEAFSRPESPAQLAPEVLEVPEVVVAPESVAAPAAAEVPAPAEPAPPELVTKALPGYASRPGRRLAANWPQTFTSAIVRGFRRTNSRLPPLCRCARPLFLVRRPRRLLLRPAPVPATTSTSDRPVTEQPAITVQVSDDSARPKRCRSSGPTLPKPLHRSGRPAKVAASAPVEKPAEKRVEPRRNRVQNHAQKDRRNVRLPRHTMRSPPCIWKPRKAPGPSSPRASRSASPRRSSWQFPESPIW